MKPKKCFVKVTASGTAHMPGGAITNPLSKECPMPNEPICHHCGTAITGGQQACMGAHQLQSDCIRALLAKVEQLEKRLLEAEWA